jgi:hypothetical protein
MASVLGLVMALAGQAALPPDYKGKPIEDSVYRAGAQVIPGRVECAYFDFGGEGWLIIAMAPIMAMANSI